MIIDKPATPSAILHDSSILMPIVESLRTADMVVVSFNQLVDIEYPIMADTSIIPPVPLIEQIITLALPHGGIYFDGL